MEKVRTINYGTVKENFGTVSEALKLSDTVSLPVILVERCEMLLGDFIVTHLDSRDDAIIDATRCWELLNAKLHSIHDDLCEAAAMLVECHHYVSEIREERDEKGGMEK